MWARNSTIELNRAVPPGRLASTMCPGGSKVLLVVALLLLSGCDGGIDPAPTRVKAATASVSMNPAAWVFQYSPGMPPTPTGDPAGGWAFDFPTRPNSVHYLVTTANPRPTVNVSMNFEISASADAVFDFRTNPNNTCASPPSLLHLYIQRVGDEMTGQGQYAFYRWFSIPTVVLANGTFTLTAPIDPSQWIDVWGRPGSASPADFIAAMSNIANLGMTFGGGCFAGHGVWLTAGSARMSVRSYSAQ